VLDNLSP